MPCSYRRACVSTTNSASLYHQNLSSYPDPSIRKLVVSIGIETISLTWRFRSPSHTSYYFASHLNVLSMSIPEQEGSVTFDHQSLPRPATTWYKVFGDLLSSKTPLILLHGGPGMCHEYMLPFADLTKDYGIPTILYDQIGNGKNTHYPEKKGDGAFWSEDLFRMEIDNLVDHLQLRERGFYVLGQSWGGMLGASYACTQPKGLKKLVICNSPASMDLWVKSATKLKQQLPKETMETLDRLEESRDFENPEYEKAVVEFYKRFLCRVEPWPAPEASAAIEHVKKDGTTYETMNGPSEFSVVGSLRDWSIIEDLHKISVPTLLLNGVYDEAQDECVAPYFQHIQNVKWVTLDNASHLSHVEQRPKTMQIVGSFLSW